jgi:hypothetical protein
MVVPPNITGIDTNALEVGVVANNIEITSWECKSKYIASRAFRLRRVGDAPQCEF